MKKMTIKALATLRNDYHIADTQTEYTKLFYNEKQ